MHLGDTLFDQIGALQAAVEAAQATPEGRAKIALAAAIGDFPGWAHADNPRPAPDDLDTQQAAQFEHMMEMAFFGLALGADIDGKVGRQSRRPTSVSTTPSCCTARTAATRCTRCTSGPGST